MARQTDYLLLVYGHDSDVYSGLEKYGLKCKGTVAYQREGRGKCTTRNKQQ
jgi:hypothetical protein